MAWLAEEIEASTAADLKNRTTELLHVDHNHFEAITGHAELLLMNCPEGAPHFDKLNKIVSQVAKLGDITQKLMCVTRYETKTYMDQQIIDIDRASGNSNRS